MQNIISKLITKWFEWQLKEKREKILKLEKKNQKLINSNIESNIEYCIDEVMASISERLEWYIDAIDDEMDPFNE